MYDYAIDPWGREDRQEALGNSFAILFNIANEKQKEKILENTIRSKNGITCLYPCYERYIPYGIGRHSGTVWPFAQAFFAEAAAANFRPDIFAFELGALTKSNIDKVSAAAAEKKNTELTAWLLEFKNKSLKGIK